MKWIISTAVALSLLTAGCATAGGGGGLFPGDDGHEAAARRVVAERAKFDLGCEQVSLTRLGDVTRLSQQETSVSIGAIGCDKKATYYVECVSNWGNITCNPRLNSQQAAQ